MQHSYSYHHLLYHNIVQMVCFHYYIIALFNNVLLLLLQLCTTEAVYHWSCVPLKLCTTKAVLSCILRKLCATEATTCTTPTLFFLKPSPCYTLYTGKFEQDDGMYACAWWRLCSLILRRSWGLSLWRAMQVCWSIHDWKYINLCLNILFSSESSNALACTVYSSKEDQHSLPNLECKDLVMTQLLCKQFGNCNTIYNNNLITP